MRSAEVRNFRSIPSQVLCSLKLWLIHERTPLQNISIRRGYLVEIFRKPLEQLFLQMYLNSRF